MIRALLANFRGTGPWLFTILGIATATFAMIAVARDARAGGGTFWREVWKLELPFLVGWSLAAIILVGLKQGEVLTPPARSVLHLDPFYEFRLIDPSEPLGGFFLIAGNALLFAPAGFFVALWRPRWRWWAIVLAGIGLSFTMEASQLLFVKDRDAATDDLILNTLGVTLGVLVARTLLALHARWRRGDSNP